MASKIFVNLPVANLDVSMAFFRRLGFDFNPQFTDETAACMVISDDIFAMLLTHAKFAPFTPRKIADARQTTEVLTCLSVDSKERVNEIADAAKSSGGEELREAQDHGFMYLRCFSDPDGHIWEIVWMDPAFARQADEAAAS